MSEKIYGWLLRLYPEPFRREYGAALVQLFRDRFQAESGVLARIRLWLDLIVDLTQSIPREHLRTGRTRVDQRRYCLSENALTAMFRRSVLAPAILFYLFTILGFSLAWLGHAPPNLRLMVYAALGIGGLAKLRGFRKFKQRWRTFEVVIDAERIQQNRCGRALTLSKTAVTEILEESPGLILLTAGVDAMFIPSRLNGYEEIREQLDNWMPVKQHVPPNGASTLLLTSGALPLYPAMLLVPLGVWFLVLAIISTLCVLPIFFGMQPIDTSRNAPPRIERSKRPASVSLRSGDGIIVRRYVPMGWFAVLGLATLPVFKCLIILAQHALS